MGSAPVIYITNHIQEIVHWTMRALIILGVWVLVGYLFIALVSYLLRHRTRDLFRENTAKDTYQYIKFKGGYVWSMNPFIVDDLVGAQIGMDFMIADLNHDAQKSEPRMGDALIVLTVDGMGFTITKDRRGNFNDGIPIKQPAERHEPAHDSFKVWMADGEDETYHRYQIRPCGLAKRTWVVVL